MIHAERTRKWFDWPVETGTGAMATRYLLGDFEDSQETDAAQNGHAQRRHDVRLREHHLHDTANDDEAVEAVE